MGKEERAGNLKNLAPFIRKAAFENEMPLLGEKGNPILLRTHTIHYVL
jgi:hypothetical protein